MKGLINQLDINATIFGPPGFNRKGPINLCLSIPVQVRTSETSVAWNPRISFFKKFGTMVLSQNLIFCMKIKIKVFYKLISSFLVTIARHSQSIQNENFVKSFNLSRTKGGMKLIFIHADKYQTFIQIFSTNFFNFLGHGYL